VTVTATSAEKSGALITDLSASSRFSAGTVVEVVVLVTDAAVGSVDAVVSLPLQAAKSRKNAAPPTERPRMLRF
jgi:hypothetical protein